MNATLQSSLASPPAPWLAPQAVRDNALFTWSTSRILLRYWQPADAPAMLAALNVDRASFLPWLPWVKTQNKDVDECLNSISKMHERRTRTDPPADDFTLAIIDPATNFPIGGTGLHRIVHAAHEGEIGYWIRPDLRRQGLCTHALAALLSWAFTPQSQQGWGLRRIHIRCAASNLASQRVPCKLNLREEARLVAERFVNTVGWEDTLVWGVLAHEWDIAAMRLN